MFSSYTANELKDHKDKLKEATTKFNEVMDIQRDLAYFRARYESVASIPGEMDGHRRAMNEHRDELSNQIDKWRDEATANRTIKMIDDQLNGSGGVDGLL